MILDRQYRDARKKLHALLVAKAERQVASGDQEGALASGWRAAEVYPEGANAQPVQVAQPAQAPPLAAAPLPPAPADPGLLSIGVSPRSVSPGAVLTLTYEINNPNGWPMPVVLGASIRTNGGAWIDDSANDARVSASPGRSQHSRQFRIPSNAAGGSYEVWQSLLDEPLKRSYAKKTDSGLVVAGGQPVSQPSAPSASAPADAVRRFYAAIDSGNLQTAWDLLSPRVQGNGNFSSWSSGYSQTRAARATASTVSQSGDRATVSFSLESVDSMSSGPVTKRFQGTWNLILVNGQWRLDRADVRQVG